MIAAALFSIMLTPSEICKKEYPEDPKSCIVYVQICRKISSKSVEDCEKSYFTHTMEQGH